MRTFTNALAFAMFSLLIACQQPAPEGVETGTEPDTLAYSYSYIQKEIPCKEDKTRLCLEVNIERIKIDAGASTQAAKKIEQGLLAAISESSNTEEGSKSPEVIAENLVQEYRQIKSEMPDYELPWEYHSDFEVYLNRNGLFGVQLTNYSFTGGAHGNSFLYFYTFDADNGQALSLKDLILSKKYPRFLALAEEQFRTTRGIDSTQSYEDAGFWFDEDRFSLNNNFKYSEKGLEIVFNPYEIAPYSEGEIVLLFPYGAIKEMVKPEYRFRNMKPGT